jgi:hypothetical protein
MSHPGHGVTHVNLTILNEYWSKIDNVDNDITLSFKSFNGQFQRRGDFTINGVISLLSVYYDVGAVIHDPLMLKGG